MAALVLVLAALAPWLEPVEVDSDDDWRPVEELSMVADRPQGMWLLKLWNNLDLRWMLPLAPGVVVPDPDPWPGVAPTELTWLGLESDLDRRLNASNVNNDPDDERPDRGDDEVAEVGAMADDGDAWDGDNSAGSSPPDLRRTLDASLAMVNVI